MRLLQVVVPGRILPDVESALDENEVDYYVIDEASSGDYDAVVYFSVEVDEVESILDQLYEAGLSSDDHGVLVNAKTDIFRRVERQQETESKSASGPYARISDVELQAEARNQLLDVTTFVVMTALSGIVATVGLILDSAAVIIGSMVIAPLLGPALSATVGTVIDDQELFRTGVKYQVGGGTVAIASAALFSWLLKTSYIAPPGKEVANTAQIASRLSPDILSLILALGAGTAGVLSLATGTASAIVGVMIAAALVPPAATVGIALAWGLPILATDAGILVLVNLLAINFAGLVAFWHLGYRPQSWLGLHRTRWTMIKRVTAVVLAIAIVSVPLVITTHSKIQGAKLEERVEGDVSDILRNPQYADVELRKVQVIKDPTTLTHPPDEVVVVLGVPPGRDNPRIHEEIIAHVTRHTSQDIDVRVEYVYSAGASSPSR